MAGGHRGAPVSPFRWDVVIVGFLLAVPVLVLGLRGDLTAYEVATRLLWCLAAAWGAVALVRFASAPRQPSPQRRPDPTPPIGAEPGGPAS